MRLVDDLLDVSRITRGKIELQRERIELGRRSSRSGIEMARPLLEQRRQRLDARRARRGPARRGRRQPARAGRRPTCSPTPRSTATRTATITIARRAPRRRLRAAVACATRASASRPSCSTAVFDIFVQEPQSIDRSKGGLGLGLAIVRNLVALHGGRVSARSDGLGQRQRVHRRAAAPRRADAPTATAPAAPRARDRPSARAAARRVLVVDDNVDAADGLAELLTSLGLRGAGGPRRRRRRWSVAPTFRPDVCLLDIGLPVMDGYELARRACAQRRPIGAAIRIVAVTGYGQDADRQRAREAGFDAHLVKPVNLDALDAALAGRPVVAPGEGMGRRGEGPSGFWRAGAARRRGVVYNISYRTCTSGAEKALEPRIGAAPDRRWRASASVSGGRLWATARAFVYWFCTRLMAYGQILVVDDDRTPRVRRRYAGGSTVPGARRRERSRGAGRAGGGLRPKSDLAGPAHARDGRLGVRPAGCADPALVDIPICMLSGAEPSAGIPPQVVAVLRKPVRDVAAALGRLPVLLNVRGAGAASLTAQEPDQGHRLGHDQPGHLGLSDTPVDEHDGHFDRAEPVRSAR